MKLKAAAAVVAMMALMMTPQANAGPEAEDTDGRCSACHPATGRAEAQAPRWSRGVASPARYSVASSPSETCMSCHDGSSGPAVVHGSSHPVGVSYDLAQMGGRGGLRPSFTPSGLGGTIAQDLLVNGNVECTSCHDQHADHGAGRTTLRLSNEGSRLCLACHDK